MTDFGSETAFTPATPTLLRLMRGAISHPAFMTKNLKFNKKMRGKAAYDQYDNYDAIEVPFTDAIPSDYDGAMGVPISFLDKYNPDQFKILGTSDNGLVDDQFK